MSTSASSFERKFGSCCRFDAISMLDGVCVPVNRCECVCICLPPQPFRYISLCSSSSVTKAWICIKLLVTQRSDVAFNHYIINISLILPCMFCGNVAIDVAVAFFLFLSLSPLFASNSIFIYLFVSCSPRYGKRWKKTSSSKTIDDDNETFQREFEQRGYIATCTWRIRTSKSAEMCFFFIEKKWLHFSQISYLHCFFRKNLLVVEENSHNYPIVLRTNNGNNTRNQHKLWLFFFHKQTNPLCPNACKTIFRCIKRHSKTQILHFRVSVRIWECNGGVCFVFVPVCVYVCNVHCRWSQAPNTLHPQRA